MPRRIRSPVESAVDYGSIALVAFVAAIFLIEPLLDRARDIAYSPGLWGISGILGVLLGLLAVRLWRDVRTARGGRGP